MQYSTLRLKVALTVLILLASACNRQVPAWNEGKVVIIVPETGQNARSEFERELARLFAEQLQTSLETIPMPQDQAIVALQQHRAHLAAISLRRENMIASLQIGPDYQRVRELVVCNHNQPVPDKLADLSSRKLAVAAGSAQDAVLRESQKMIPLIQWQIRHQVTSRELLAEVSEGTLDCTAVDELQLADAHNYYPNLVEAFEIASPSMLVWGLPWDADPELLRQAQVFFSTIKTNGTLNRLLDRYYGHNHRLDKMDAAAFIASIKTTLPHYRPLFEEAASITGEDWRLLAALAYQESQWNPLASSPTNVRGMMMLTEDTADRMQVKNRLDARESIMAGAQYLSMLKNQMPERIPEPDRTWLALAAYNQGFGHLEDARILTSRAGLNPDSWSDIKKWMPKLNQPGYYETLKRGYARGGEAVILVENIRNYYDMLKRLEPEPLSVQPGSFTYRLIEPLKRLLH